MSDQTTAAKSVEHPMAAAVKFLLRNVVINGHLPATAQAQNHLDAIDRCEAEMFAEEAYVAQEAPMPDLASIPGLTLVGHRLSGEPAASTGTSVQTNAATHADSAADAHNAAVNKTK